MSRLFRRVNIIKPLILICDDSREISSLVKLALEDIDYEVKLLENPKQVVAEAVRLKPSVILLDWQMPVMNGDEVVKILKDNEETSHIPVIIYSAHPKAKFSALEAHADDFLAKPFDFDDLVKVIGHHCPSHI